MFSLWKLRVSASARGEAEGEVNKWQRNSDEKGWSKWLIESQYQIDSEYSIGNNLQIKRVVRFYHFHKYSTQYVCVFLSPFAFMWFQHNAATTLDMNIL